MSDDKRREKADLLLEIHELKDARKEWKHKHEALQHRLRNLTHYLDRLSLDDRQGIFQRTESRNQILDDFPTLEQFIEVDQQQIDIQETTRKLHAKKKELGLDASL